MKKLILVPTELEARPLREMGLEVEVIGMGPIEAAVNSYKLLTREDPDLVLLVGVGGAYPESGLGLGDLAVASGEFFGDFGICYRLIEGDFVQTLDVQKEQKFNHPLLEKALSILEEGGFEVAFGPFVTVCCATRDPLRAQTLATRYRGALVENMEGFAVARVALEVGVVFFELRSISNLVDDPERPWEIEKALLNLGEALKWLISRL